MRPTFLPRPHGSRKLKKLRPPFDWTKRFRDSSQVNRLTQAAVGDDPMLLRESIPPMGTEWTHDCKPDVTALVPPECVGPEDTRTAILGRMFRTARGRELEDEGIALKEEKEGTKEKSEPLSIKKQMRSLGDPVDPPWAATPETDKKKIQQFNEVLYTLAKIPCEGDLSIG